MRYFNKWLIEFIVFLAFFISSCNSNQQPSKPEKPSVKPLQEYAILFHENLDFENLNTVDKAPPIANSNSKFFYVKPDVEFINGFSKPLGEIKNFKNIDSIKISFSLFTQEKLQNLKLVWVIEGPENKTEQWSGSLLESKQLKDWDSFYFTFPFDVKWRKSKNTLKIYIWNEGKNEFWLDNFSYTLLGLKPLSTVIDTSVGNLFYDFETPKDLINIDCIKKGKAYSGMRCCDLSGGEEYGVMIKRKFGDLGFPIIKKVAASVWLYPLQEGYDLMITITIKSAKTGKNIDWFGKSTNNNFALKTWTHFNIDVNLPIDKIEPEDEIEIGIWNRGKKGILVDDFQIVFGTDPEPRSIGVSASNYLTFEPLWLKKETIDVEVLNTYKPFDAVLGGLFYKNKENLESILHISDKNARLISYNKSLNAFVSVWETSDQSHFLLDTAYRFLATDFDHNGITEILAIHKMNGTCQFYIFNNNHWELKEKLQSFFPADWLKQFVYISPLKSLAAGFALFLPEKSELLQYKNNLWVKSKLDNTNRFIHAKDILMDWNQGYALKWNNEWRFELRQIKLNPLENTLQPIEFKGFLGQANPKYYEFTKMLSGFFVQNKNRSLIVFSYNCADSEYLGDNCNQIENNSQMPNAISLYQ